MTEPSSEEHGSVRTNVADHRVHAQGQHHKRRSTIAQDLAGLGRDGWTNRSLNYSVSKYISTLCFQRHSTTQNVARMSEKEKKKIPSTNQKQKTHVL